MSMAVCWIGTSSQKCDECIWGSRELTVNFPALAAGAPNSTFGFFTIREGRLLNGPRDAGPPIGYVAFIRDPDGHTLEVSFGQEVGLTIQQATEFHCGGRGMPRR
jgi:hypothetical protein